MNQYYDPYAEEDPNYWGADSGDLMSGYSPDYNSMNYGQDMLDNGGSSYNYDPYQSSGYDPYQSSGYDPYAAQDPYQEQYDPYGQGQESYDPYGYDPYQGSYDQYGYDPYQQPEDTFYPEQDPYYTQDYGSDGGQDYSYDDPYGYNQWDQNQEQSWEQDYFNNQDPWGDYGQNSEDAAPVTEQGDDTQGQTPEEAPPPIVPKFDYGNTNINNYQTPELKPPEQTGPTQAETLAQAQSQTLTPQAAPPKPSWMEQIESGEAYKPYHSFANNPLPYLSQEQYNTMDPSEYEGYMALVPEWQQKDFALNMQKSWTPGRQRRSAYMS